MPLDLAPIEAQADAMIGEGTWTGLCPIMVRNRMTLTERSA